MVGEELSTLQEPGNPEDSFAVAVTKGGIVVGHLPREISKTCFYFINHGGDISCKVIGNRQRSIMLEGGLESWCVLYRFKGKKKLIEKLTTVMQKLNFIIFYTCNNNITLW